MDFPPNSEKAKQEAQREPKRVERVVADGARRRKKPLGKQFKEVFFGGDARTAGSYVVMAVIIPAIRDTLFEAGQAAIEKMIYGESRAGRRSRFGSPPSGATGYVTYNRPHTRDPVDDRPPMPGRSISRRARARHAGEAGVLSGTRGARVSP